MDTATLEDNAASPFAAADARRALYLRGGGDEQRARLGSLGDFQLVDDISAAELVVVSTRMSRAEMTSMLPKLRAAARCPIVVLTHTGGESAAVEVMRQGGAGVVAEGNEDALGAYLTGEAYDSSLVETYDRRVGSARARAEQGPGSDDATNLPGAVAFEERLEELDEHGVIPRVAFLHVLHFEAAARRLATEASDVLRRRLAVQYRELSRVVAAELFTLGPADFALVGTALSPARAQELGRQLTRVTESFAPLGNHTLRLAMGHAGPEVTSELSTLRELAARALAVATEQAKSTIISADSMSLGLAATTELEAALRMLDVIDRYDRHHPGHGMRVARLAAELARHLGFEGSERAQIRLAAHLHDIGKVGLPPEAIAAHPSTLDPELLDAYRSHPARGATMLRASAGAEVAEAVEAHHEHWDGSGFPRGLAGDDIPLMARIIALVDFYDEVNASAEHADDVKAQLRAAAGVQLDPQMVDAALPLLLRSED